MTGKDSVLGNPKTFNERVTTYGNNRKRSRTRHTSQNLSKNNWKPGAGGKKDFFLKRKIHWDLRERIKMLRSEHMDYIRNKQGRSKVLTEKTIQVSVACFYSYPGKDIASWCNKSEVACGSFWSHRWKQSIDQSSQSRSWTLHDSPKPLSNHLCEN